MAVIRTVTGDIPAESIGMTSMHEHVLGTFEVWLEKVADSPSINVPVDPDTKVAITNLGILHRNPLLLRDNLRLDDERLAAAEVQKFKDAGGSCLVDVSNIGIRTNPSGVRRVAQQTGLSIVAGSSFYLEGCHPPYVAKSSIDELAAIIIKDVKTGIEDTDIRAGVIGEVGTMTVTEAEVKVLRASARAHMATGAVITLHTHVNCRFGEKIIGILREEGVQPNRIIVGHMDENLVAFGPGLAHLDYHRRLADLGVWLQYDTFGAEWYWDSIAVREPMDAERATAVATLASEGHLSQLLLGQDVWLKQGLKSYGGLGYDHLLTAVPVMLRQAGLKDADIETMLVDNPRRALALSTS